MAANKAPISAIGTGMFVWLNKPDTKFKAEGEYHVDLKYDGSEPGFDEMIEFIHQTGDEAFEEWKAADKKNANKAKKGVNIRYPDQPVEDDEGEETGETKVSFKTSAIVKKTGKPRKLIMKDSRDKPVKAQVYPGSRMRVMYRVGTNYVSSSNTFFVTLYISQVQIIELVEGEGGGSFGTVEGGYVGEEDDGSTDDDGDTTDDDDGGSQDEAPDEENDDF